MFRRLIQVALCFGILMVSVNAYAQRGTNDSILLGGIVVNNDTFPMVYLPDVIKTGNLPRHLARERARYDRLRYNVYKTYPYAVIAADVLKDVDVKLAKLEDKKQERKAYL